MMNNFVNDLFLGPLHRKVARYLNETTCDSVCADLGKVLSPQLSGWRKLDHLQSIFVKYCIQYSSDHQPYWNEESFKSHIRDTHSSAAVSDAAVQLLWRSFHFYAYHPFPRDLQHARVDYDAFQRAALLTVFRCDGLLGTRELDWYWRRDDAFFRDASLARMFRSLAPQDKVRSEDLTEEDDIKPSLSDAMDVLVMLGPQFIHAMPSEGQLEAVARRLFASGDAAVRGAVRRQDVSTLMDLVLSMRLRKEKWGLIHHYGSVVEAGPADEEFTNVLVASLATDESEFITPEQLLSSKITMPNLLFRFHQLWAVLFQPSMASDESKPHSSNVALLNHVEGALSLFTPQLQAESGILMLRESRDTHIALEEVQVPPASNNLAMDRLMQGVSRDCSSEYVVVFTGDVSESNSKAVIGAYISFLPSTTSGEAPDASRREASYILLQLQPEFNLVRGTKADLSEVIRMESGTTHIPESSDKPYWVGSPSGQAESEWRIRRRR
ncbi:hypothetical protein BJ166DRAFT_80603 [Pestalotiopsis sp. NC0098]|nr:hypothetical protein BJ166DRAFT_80603 [Pestalotiopsis sp. NC0098]